MSDVLFEKFNWLKAKQGQTMKNFGMVGMGYVCEYHNEAMGLLNQLQSENTKLQAKLDLAVEALEKYKKATSDLEPVIAHQLQIVIDFEDFAESVGAGYISKEQREWNKMAYEAAEIIESRYAEKALEQIKEIDK
jgi:2-phospho-L-lactate transferase/gluconeogenesis factor (CofD/UPF0052 family)